MQAVWLQPYSTWVILLLCNRHEGHPTEVVLDSPQWSQLDLALTYHRALREISNTRRPSPRSSLSSGASTYLPVSTSVHNTFTKAYLCTLIAVACGAASPGRAVRCADPLVHGSNNMLVQARLIMPSVFHARHLGGRLANNIRRQTTN